MDCGKVAIYEIGLNLIYVGLKMCCCFLFVRFRQCLNLIYVRLKLVKINFMQIHTIMFEFNICEVKIDFQRRGIELYTLFEFNICEVKMLF